MENINKNQIAKICHNINKEFCNYIGDTTQLMWEDAPDWQKNSALLGVEYHLENHNSKPEDSHNSWLKQKEIEGWKYGVVKNVETKEHPCYVPFDQLPKEQQFKDVLFSTIVKSFI